MNIWALDDRPYDSYGIEVVRAARARGHTAQLFTKEVQVDKPGYLFARLAQWEPRISFDRKEISKIHGLPTMKPIQDDLQVQCYENKLLQARAFKDWMPQTWIEGDPEEAFRTAHSVEYPLVSKASVGSASKNVRILRNANEAIAEIEQAFGAGIPVVAGAGNAAVQKGYVLWQEFVPHDVTYRVTRVGSRYHCYRRFNYDDRPVAAPSRLKQTQPVTLDRFMNPVCAVADVFGVRLDIEPLKDFCDRFTVVAGTKWCAMDILLDVERARWRLLETALAWARGNDPAGNATFYGTNYSLNTQHELLIEEIEKGVFG